VEEKKLLFRGHLFFGNFFVETLFLGILTIGICAQFKAAAAETLFDPQKVREISWTEQGKTIRLKWKNDSWSSPGAPKDFKPDSWNIHRRLVLLSQASGLTPVDLKNPPTGSLVFVTSKDIQTGQQAHQIEGQFNQEGFQWTSGPHKSQGYLFSNHPEIADLFDEGLKSISLHEITQCHPDKVNRLEFAGKAGWALTKKKTQWVLTQEQKENPARPAVVANFLKLLCDVSVDHFFPSKSTIPQGANEVLEVYEGEKKITLSSTADQNFIFGDAPVFTSKNLVEALKESVDDFKDPSLEVGRVALDPSKSKNERILAIRAMKDSKSPEGIPALKALVDEKTEIDLYRYEAVDALAAIGTKEAFKIIADRLGEVGRSGFELRLARALALGMGHNFVSDEKTPEPRRRAEVQDLLSYYRQKGAGK
jgi:hypothetical protein